MQYVTVIALWLKIKYWWLWCNDTFGSKNYASIMCITFQDAFQFYSPFQAVVFPFQGYISVVSLLFSLICPYKLIHVMVITWAWGICLICMFKAWGPQRMRAFTSGKSWMHVTSVMLHFVAIVTASVVWIPQVIVTLACEVISTNCLIVKELSTYIHLYYHFVYEITMTIHCGLE